MFILALWNIGITRFLFLFFSKSQKVEKKVEMLFKLLAPQFYQV